MKKIYWGLVLLIIGFCIYWLGFKSKPTADEPKQAPLAVKKHSEDFNKTVANAMNAYFDLKNAFVEADTTKAKESCKKFIQLIDSIPLQELKKDTTLIYETAQSNLTDVKANAQSLLMQNDITEMRQDFRMISEMLYPFFTTINYEGAKMYWQNCPMAFGEGKAANWISNTVEILNPYLGKNHNDCGEIKDTIKAK